MEQIKWNKGVEEIKKKIVLNDTERSRIFQHIQNSPLSPEVFVKSPWTIYSFMRIWNNNRIVYYAVIACLIIVGAGQVAYASQNSLPGDALYKIKVNVVEPLHRALIFSSKTKAQYESNLAVERLTEAETLASQNKLDEPKQKQINTLVEKSTKMLHKDLKHFSNDKPSEAETITKNFQAQMNAHAKILETINPDKDTHTQANNAQSEHTAHENGPKPKDDTNKDKTKPESHSKK